MGDLSGIIKSFLASPHGKEVDEVCATIRTAVLEAKGSDDPLELACVLDALRAALVLVEPDKLVPCVEMAVSIAGRFQKLYPEEFKVPSGSHRVNFLVDPVRLMEFSQIKELVALFGGREPTEFQKNLRAVESFPAYFSFLFFLHNILPPESGAEYADLRGRIKLVLLHALSDIHPSTGCRSLRFAALPEVSEEGEGDGAEHADLAAALAESSADTDAQGDALMGGSESASSVAVSEIAEAFQHLAAFVGDPNSILPRWAEFHKNAEACLNEIERKTPEKTQNSDESSFSPFAAAAAAAVHEGKKGEEDTPPLSDLPPYLEAKPHLLTFVTSEVLFRSSVLLKLLIALQAIAVPATMDNPPLLSEQSEKVQTAAEALRQRCDTLLEKQDPFLRSLTTNFLLTELLWSQWKRHKAPDWSGGVPLAVKLAAGERHCRPFERAKAAKGNFSGGPPPFVPKKKPKTEEKGKRGDPRLGEGNWLTRRLLPNLVKNVKETQIDLIEEVPYWVGQNTQAVVAAERAMAKEVQQKEKEVAALENQEKRKKMMSMALDELPDEEDEEMGENEKEKDTDKEKEKEKKEKEEKEEEDPSKKEELVKLRAELEEKKEELKAREKATVAERERRVAEYKQKKRECFERDGNSIAAQHRFKLQNMAEQIIAEAKTDGSAPAKEAGRLDSWELARQQFISLLLQYHSQLFMDLPLGGLSTFDDSLERLALIYMNRDDKTYTLPEHLAWPDPEYVPVPYYENTIEQKMEDLKKRQEAKERAREEGERAMRQREGHRGYGGGGFDRRGPPGGGGGYGQG
eukprot:Cvel_30992.t1-p1 / transcript=Cvel_30992.t1 / gene=Cvel_30992 / organism=Chromera_velia_CCMP2878 / gene_product=hypothetical protein / transcript_product=hypothetical protein / location=Cvel_scaffold4529:4368-9200(+) / protein_length=801 / sequence_SO=supercontig / SO=protein_coding / is_pseudo=false